MENARLEEQAAELTSDDAIAKEVHVKKGSTQREASGSLAANPGVGCA